MKFNAKKFRQDRRHSHLLTNAHLAVLDGRETATRFVRYSDGRKLELQGIDYEVDGEPYELYPVLPEWCDEEKENRPS